jgi:hypothetical protein
MNLKHNILALVGKANQNNWVWGGGHYQAYNNMPWVNGKNLKI